MARFSKEQKINKLKEISSIAKKKGGACLSKDYINSKTKLKFNCKHGHFWKTLPNQILKGRWCHECAAQKLGRSYNLNIEDMTLPGNMPMAVFKSRTLPL